MDHACVLYRDAAEYAAAIVPFVRDGLAAGTPVLVAVPRANGDVLRAALGPDAERVEIVDMTRLGANPARIIPAIRRFVDAHAGRRVRFVGEPIWPGRSPEALREATRHEALINLAFADADADILCPYDAARLAPDVLADAHRTHPVVVEDERRTPSSAYAGPVPPAGCDTPLPMPPAPAGTLSFTGREHLAPLRALVADQAEQAGLDAERSSCLAVAVNELATNSLTHGGAGGTAHVWRSPDRLYVQIEGHGTIADPLVGRVTPSSDATGGRGLWLVNQLCDLVEVRTGPAGTTVRLHAELA